MPPFPLSLPLTFFSKGPRGPRKGKGEREEKEWSPGLFKLMLCAGLSRLNGCRLPHIPVIHRKDKRKVSWKVGGLQECVLSFLLFLYSLASSLLCLAVTCHEFLRTICQTERLRGTRNRKGKCEGKCALGAWEATISSSSFCTQPPRLSTFPWNSLSNGLPKDTKIFQEKWEAIRLAVHHSCSHCWIWNSLSF